MRRYCTLGGTKFRLPVWLSPAERFSDQLIPVDPNLQFLPNDRTTLLARQASTFWQMNDWRAGEGFDRWKPDREGGGYYRSTNVRPKRIGDGLILGPEPEITQDSTGIADFVDGRVLGIAQGSVWTVDDVSGYEWDTANGRWGTAVSTGATAGQSATSLADGQDTWIYTGHNNGTIRRWKSGSSEVHYGTGTGDDFTTDPVVVAFGERLFALDGDDLYEIDKDTADTRTQVVDASGASDVFLAAQPDSFPRISVSDKGPIWLQRLDNGQTRIWEYNVAQDVGYITGEVPAGLTYPTSIFYARGFFFVGFVVAAGQTGDAYQYFQRGAQRGTLGPVRDLVSNSGPLVICGSIGDELVFYRDDALWAYNLSDGGIYHLADATGTDLGADTFNGVVFGPDVFIARMTGDKVERFRTDRHTTETATLESGLYDMGYLDIPKKLVEVTVVTEPLPANTSVSVAYTTDGTTYTALTGAHDTDGASEKTWIVSTSAGTTVRGRRFGIRLTLATTDATTTPTVRGVLVRARTAAHERVIVMRVDVSTDGEQTTDVLLAALHTMVANQDVVALSLPFEVGQDDSPETFDVEVRNVHLPDAEDPESRLAATVELAAVELVVA